MPPVPHLGTRVAVFVPPQDLRSRHAACAAAMESGGGALSWMSELSRALDQGIQSAGTFLETNSALLANTLALDKLSEFDGLEVWRSGACVLAC